MSKKGNITNSTSRPRPEEMPERWFLVDAAGKTLGRLASKLAAFLIGKDQPTYDPSVLNKNRVVVINAEKIKVTGNKLAQKTYYRHSGYLGGLKSETLEDVMAKNPAKAIEMSVSRMLPKNKLRKSRLASLKVYNNESHPHEGQKPNKLEI
ncbi:MAG: 50S ribosomal protein L13 [Patescibacteria group bacterium]|nr:50S ribosomal protein L13 [Patescibacteria group bacterium]